MSEITIDTELPGGNAVIERVEGNEVWVRPDLRDTDGAWFYWYFRVRGAARQSLRVHLTEPRTLTCRGPAISIDGGWTWEWVQDQIITDNTFTIPPTGAEELHVSMAMPYTLRHLQAWLAEWGGHERLQQRELGRSRGGRTIPLLRLSAPERLMPQVMITARHHCCEMMASYMLEGFMEAVLTRVEIPAEVWIVPMVDIDGVEAGDQGKNRRPHDHNRDYSQGFYPEVRSIRRHAEELRRLMVFLDLHCPYVLGEHNEHIYLVGSAEAPIEVEQERFCAFMEEENQSQLPFRADGFLPFGEAWNTAANWAGGKSAARWFERLPRTRLSTTIEFPYADVMGVTVTAERARAFGEDLARALAAYLESQDARRI